MILGINPKVDYAFKKLFGSPAQKGLLIHLLNSVLVGRLPAASLDALLPVRAD
jgi:hypothetical protein